MIRKKHIFYILFVLAIGVICLNLSHFNIGKALKGPVDLDSIAIEDIKDQYVKTKIIYNIGAFYEKGSKKGSNNQVKKKYYIIPVGEDSYMSAVFDKKDFAIANAILEDTYSYLGGDIDQLSKYLNTEGFIERMKGEQLESYYHWFVESGSLGTTDIEEIKKCALPYQLVLGKGEVYKVYLLTILSCFAFLYAIYLLIRF